MGVVAEHDESSAGTSPTEQFFNFSQPNATARLPTEQRCLCAYGANKLAFPHDYQARLGDPGLDQHPGAFVLYDVASAVALPKSSQRNFTQLSARQSPCDLVLRHDGCRPRLCQPTDQR